MQTLLNSGPREKRLLQIAVAVAGFIPVGAGFFGVTAGLAMVDVPVDISADSHFRYLSGLLLGIGLAYWAMIPRIETHGDKVLLLTAIVFIGGLGRLLGLAINGPPDGPMLFGLAMELVVTPALCLWQRRVARQGSSSSTARSPSR